MEPNGISIQDQMEATLAFYKIVCIVFAAVFLLASILLGWREFSRWGVNKIKVTIWPDSRVEVEDHGGGGKSKVEIIKHHPK